MEPACDFCQRTDTELSRPFGTDRGGEGPLVCQMCEIDAKTAIRQRLIAEFAGAYLIAKGQLVMVTPGQPIQQRPNGLQIVKGALAR